MAETGASYDEKLRVWWVPQAQFRRAADILDRAQQNRAMREARKKMDWSRVWEARRRY